MKIEKPRDVQCNLNSQGLQGRRAKQNLKIITEGAEGRIGVGFRLYGIPLFHMEGRLQGVQKTKIRKKEKKKVEKLKL